MRMLYNVYAIMDSGMKSRISICESKEEAREEMERLADEITDIKLTGKLYATFYDEILVVSKIQSFKIEVAETD